MKAIVVGMAIATTVFTACSNNNQPEAQTDKSATQPAAQSNPAAAPQTASIQTVLDPYMNLQKALAGDNATEAATAGKNVFESMQQLDEASLSAEQKKVYDEVKDDMKEHAEHISTNAKNIAHQREHFDILSKDMYDLVKVVKPEETLYQMHCPMYNNNKGAIWLSATKEVKNPYMGKKMLTCGTVKEEIK